MPSNVTSLSSQSFVLSLTHSIAPAVLHDNKLTHTDLKPENILFENSDYEVLTIPKKGKDKVCTHVEDRVADESLVAEKGGEADKRHED